MPDEKPKGSGGEKIYYSDDAVKVTNLRVTCKSVTVPIAKIEGLGVYPAIEKVTAATALILGCPVLIFFAYVLPSDFIMPFIVFMLSMSFGGFVWICFILPHYLELMLIVEGREVSLMRASIFKKDYIGGISNSLRNAVEDHRRFLSMKESGRLSTETGKFSLTETMRIKFIIEDYERLKAASLGKNQNQEVGSQPHP